VYIMFPLHGILLALVPLEERFSSNCKAGKIYPSSKNEKLAYSSGLT
jgi:hypothetical protein